VHCAAARHRFAAGRHFREGCPFSSEIVTLSPLGLLYPCCGMVLGEPPEEAALFVHDDISERTVDEIETVLKKVKQDLFFRVLQAAGPYQLLDAVRRRHPELAPRERFVGSCDVCLEFTRRPEVAQATRELLMEIVACLRRQPAAGEPIGQAAPWHEVTP
jgi:hypothetical protein